ncbi:sulfatase-like hydrolase/transferase [Hyphomicrobium sp. CS1GBMeth3]|uniref:sulfatase-like hydrolase/transferase n=1 Tax=Hyphomicrobium sp. CS1GBMeth3 TaxID=1892845 RepID=UPI000B076459|nr:sulfatase-like hydrolase/transferase [Hyphomicrobium sp. CS1GBMeth3]
MAKDAGLTRRNALKLGLAGAAGAAGLKGAEAAAGGTNKGTTGKRRPNILFLLVDEQRFPTVYESAALKEFRAKYLPAQGRLARSGVSFQRHYVASVACVPSRTSLYTGHYPSLHGAANTDGAAKAANDPDMHWLLPGSVPTFGHYLRHAGYRTIWKGKWHVTESDLKVPGTEQVITSYDETGVTDPEKEAIYLNADALDPFGFSGWVGPEPHGSDPLRSGSSAGQGRQARDPAIAAQVVQALKDLHASEDNSPWFLMASFTNPHDIALWGFFSNLAAEQQAAYDFSVPDFVPEEVFDRSLFGRTRLEKLDDKPSCQRSYKDAYSKFMQPAFASREYYRFYYRLHADVDRHLAQVLAALDATRFASNTIIVFTSDHGDILGAHGGLHQKWYMAYEEATRVPLVVVLPQQKTPRAVPIPTSHIDIAPTLLGLAGVDHNAVREAIAPSFTDPLPLVGRDLSPLIRGEVAAEKISEPIYFMTDDDPSRGLDQKNFIGLTYDSVAQPNHVETVITQINGEVWKYSRYFDHPRYWSAPGTPGAEGVRDVVNTFKGREGDEEGSARRIYEERVKTEPVPSEYEMYNITADPMELENLAGKPEWKEREGALRELLVEQCARKRLVPKSGPVPGEVGCRKV